MTTLDNEVEGIAELCLSILDEKFLKEHPGIIDVAGFLNSVSRTSIRVKGKYEPFDRLEIKTIREYLKKAQEGDEEALKTYRTVRDNLNFKKSYF
ncbi:MAG: hypothetical protein KKC19_01455 [Nanoarchaeota archaeon]|nr:hypothetical protein [Nanoarchaeota archaeon]